MNHFKEIYNNAVYIIKESPDIIISPNNESIKFQAFLERKDVDCWAIITAFNPKSKKLSLTLNKAKNNALKNDIQKLNYSFLNGINPATNEWPEEMTFFIKNIHQEHALTLARKYNQNAILYGKNRKVIEVLWT